MAVADRIHQVVQRLPPALQAEVLDFVEYLLTKLQQERTLQEELRAWSELSLKWALQDMEDEGEPHYSTADLQVRFQ